MNTNTNTNIAPSTVNFALRLLDWHGGQSSGLYSVGSCLLAGDFRWLRAVPRAKDELRATHETEAALLLACLTIYAGLDEFTRAYLEAALGATTGDDDRPLDDTRSLADVAPSALREAVADCLAFQRLNTLLIGDRHVEAGHDFFLTRNRHGAGFWDGDWPEADAVTLTASAHGFGEVNLYVGDDGLVYA